MASDISSEMSCASANMFYFEADQELVQVLQGGCGVSVLADIQKASEYGPRQSALGSLPQARGSTG